MQHRCVLHQYWSSGFKEVGVVLHRHVVEREREVVATQ